MLNWKKAIVIRAFADTPDFLTGTDFLRSLDDYSRVFNKARSLGFEGVQLYLEISTGLLNLNTDEKKLNEIAKRARNEGVGCGDGPGLLRRRLRANPVCVSRTDRASGEARCRNDGRAYLEYVSAFSSRNATTD